MKSSDLLPAIGFTTSLLRQNSCRITHVCNVPCNDATWFGVCARVCYNFTPPLMYHIKAQCPEQRKQNHFDAIVGRQMNEINLQWSLPKKNFTKIQHTLLHKCHCGSGAAQRTIQAALLQFGFFQTWLTHRLGSSRIKTTMQFNSYPSIKIISS